MNLIFLPQDNHQESEKNSSEYFADAFASAVLMPMGELKVKVNEYKDANGNDKTRKE